MKTSRKAPAAASAPAASSSNIESHLNEKRVFKPAKAFARQARITSMEDYRQLYEESVNKPDKFWAREAGELHWRKKWNKVLRLEAALREVVRRRQDQRRATTASTAISTAAASNKAAIIWEGEPGDKRSAHLPAAPPRRLQVRQRAQAHRREEGRPRA